MTFKEELERIFIPGYKYGRTYISLAPNDLIFDHFEPARQCNMICTGEIGQCDGTRLRFKNYANIVCPYSDGSLRFKGVSRPKISNIRW